jgi:hypothetical protein
MCQQYFVPAFIIREQGDIQDFSDWPYLSFFMLKKSGTMLPYKKIYLLLNNKAYDPWESLLAIRERRLRQRCESASY